MSPARVGLAALLLAACGGEPEDPEASQSLRDATITAEVRSRLIASDRLERLPLRVETRDGAVRIAGDVHDSSQVGEVRAVAAAVRGAERVELDLHVVPAPTPDSAAPGPAQPPAPPPAAPESLPSLEEAG